MEEELRNIKAVTYNLENGKVKESKLEKSNIFRDKIDKNRFKKNFTLPNIKEGCIIEFQYEIQSDFIRNLQPWAFQGDYPVLWSEYTTSIPQFFVYTFLAQGYHPFYIRDSKSRTTVFNISETRSASASDHGSFTSGITDYRWVMKDTIWLECTSQTLPAGYLSEFTSNRYALAIDENGGKLVKTPRYDLQENLQKRIVKSKLQEDGTLRLNASSRYEAEQQDDVYSMINYLTKDKVKEYLHNHFDFGTYDITSFDYKQNKSVLPSVDEQLNISVSNYATITGKRLFIIPNIMTRHRQRLKEDNDRKYDVSIDFAYRDIDSIEIEIPDGYTLESKLKDQEITSQFGKYISKTTVSGNKLYYYRSMEQYSGTFPASAYNELVKFYNVIYKSDRSKVVFVKKE